VNTLKSWWLVVVVVVVMRGRGRVKEGGVSTNQGRSRSSTQMRRQQPGPPHTATCWDEEVSVELGVDWPWGAWRLVVGWGGVERLGLEAVLER